MTGGDVATENPFRFTGAYQDGTGLYKMGARYYDPSLGRFTQQDPIFNPLDPSSWDRYVYAGDDPVNFDDPSGLHKCDGWHPWDCVAHVAEGAAKSVGRFVSDHQCGFLYATAAIGLATGVFGAGSLIVAEGADALYTVTVAGTTYDVAGLVGVANSGLTMLATGVAGARAGGCSDFINDILGG